MATKLTLFFLTIAMLNLSARGLSQTVSFSGRGVPLQKVLASVEQQTKFVFIMDGNLLKKAKPVTLDVREASLDNFLHKLLESQSLDYVVENKTIVISRKVVTPVEKNAQETMQAVRADTGIDVRGKIVNEDGAPMAGVSIQVKGKSKGSITDDKGSFALNNVSTNAVLIISGVNIENYEVQLNGRTQLTLSTKAAVRPLEETVVKGYYRTSKKTNTGSVATVTAEMIANQPVTDPVSALQGRVSGLMITASNGMPGSSFQVRIRGENSMRNGNEPLFIVDGVPFIFPTTLNQFSGANGNQSPLASLSPGDIERIDVLKDADATAIYGSRGANGVILITTKKGRTGESQFNVNVYTGISKIGNKLKMMNTQEYLALRNEAFANDAATKTTANAPDLLVWDQNAYTDWQDLLIGNTANLTQAQATFSGGTAQTKFLLSGTVHKEGTVLLGDFGYTRGSTHMSLDHSSKDGRFGLTASVNFSTDKNDIVPTDVSQYFGLPPNLPAYNPDGSLYWYGTTQNPVAYLNRTYETNTNNLIGNSTLRFEILPGLSVKANLGYTLTTMKQLQTLPASGFTTISPVPGSQAQYGNSDVNSYIAEPQIDYNRWVGPGKLSLLAGASWQQTKQEGYYYLGTGYSSDALLKNMASATSLTLRNYNYSEYKYQAVYGRINYDIGSKYLLNLTFRRDGSSRFADGNKFGNFGAVGAAWILSEEGFIKKGLPWLSFAKLRSSYGVTGNDQIGDYQYLDSWSAASFPYGGLSGLVPDRAFNPKFSWETNRKLEAALELGFINDRIFLTSSYYNNRSDNQLVGQTLSPQSGFTSYTSNFPALVENKGWEFDLSTTNIKTKNFNWTTTLNIALPSNKLLRYDNLKSSGDATAYEIGQSTRIIKGFRFTGVNPATGVPEFLDVNKDGLLDQANDWVIMGQTLPQYFGGFSNELRYQNLSLDIFFQFVKQEAPTIDWGPLAGAYGGMANKTLVVLDRWKTAGDITSVPRATVTTTNVANTAFRNYYRTSSAVWGDASYIRLKNVALKYDLTSITKRWKVFGTSIYLQAQNLFTKTKYNGLDPEINGFDRRFVFPINPFGSVKTPAMPVLKTITVGLNVSI